MKALHHHSTMISVVLVANPLRISKARNHHSHFLNLKFRLIHKLGSMINDHILSPQQLNTKLKFTKDKAHYQRKKKKKVIPELKFNILARQNKTFA